MKHHANHQHSRQNGRKAKQAREKAARKGLGQGRVIVPEKPQKVKFVLR